MSSSIMVHWKFEFEEMMRLDVSYFSLIISHIKTLQGGKCVYDNL